MSHEIRTPLSGVLGIATLLEDVAKVVRVLSVYLEQSGELRVAS